VTGAAHPASAYAMSGTVLSSQPYTNEMRALVIFFATGIYSGYVPVAPGTAGAALGLLLGWLLFAPLWQRSVAAFLTLFIVMFFAACFVADAAEKIFDQHDSRHIVIDEIFGMIATMFLNPTGWPWLIGGFVLFRIFDIIKIWPASRLDRLDGGAGVMLDDLAAGIYANLVLQAFRRIG
jgi:phosphatidylglycerophosphatase A